MTQSNQQLADLVASQIEKLIADSVLKPGQALPSERRLTQKLGVSRSALREGLHILRARGLIHTKAAKGSFVSNLIAPTLHSPVEHLLQSQRKAIYDLLELRELLESEAAKLAAERGTSADFALIKRRYEELQASPHGTDNLDAHAELDHAFHLAISEASHNALLVHILSSLNDLTLSSVRTSINHLYPREKSRLQIDKQHAKLYAAISSKMPEQARKAAREHIQSIRKNLQELEQEQERLKHARQRLEGWH